MDQASWRRISDIFSDCLACPEAERSGFLTELEASDSELARQVRELLQTYQQDQEFLEKPQIYQAVEVPAAWQTGTHPAGGQFAPELRAPRPRGTRRRSLFFWLLLGANLTIFCCFVFTLSVIGRYRGQSTDLGWTADPTAKGWMVTDVRTDGPAAGRLQVGDHVLEVEHNPMWLPQMLKVRPGAAYSIRVLRRGQTQDLSLTNAIVPNKRWYRGTLAYLLVSLTYLLTAVLVSVMQPKPSITRLAWAALAGEAVTVLCMLMRSYASFLRGGAYTFFFLVQLVDGPHLAFAYHFYSQVFRSDRRGKLSSSVVWLLYLWGVICALYNALCLSRYSFSPVTPLVWSHFALWHALDRIEGTFYLIAPLSICIAVAHSYVRAKGLEERRRAGWIAAGSLAGILPYFVLRWAASLGLVGANYPGIYGVVPAALIPIATGYAILKHRLFDIHVVLRRGLQYLVARNFLRFVIALPGLALAYSLVTNASRSVREVVLHNSVFISLVVLIALVLKFRDRLSSWLDRRFFRESYHQERILLALIESLPTLDSAPEMGKRVVTELAEALHPESVHFFYYAPEDRSYVKGFGTDSSADGVRIPEGSALPAVLARHDKPVSVESLPVAGFPPMSWTWLRTLRTDLIVPLNRADGSPAGFLLLGKKKSEEPYSPADRNLLRGLAGQMAVFYENLLLQERLQRQQRTHEKMRARVENLGKPWLQECPKCGRCFDGSIRNCGEDGSELTFTIPIQRVLDARYRLDRVLGRGGMGTVFAAQDLRLDRQVAVKVTEAGKALHSAWLRRFNREVRALARLQHENVVLTYDCGVVDDEAAYLVMEYVAGTTLRAEIAAGSLAPATAADRFRQLLEGVKAAHAAGIVHRDLKPENVLIARSADRRERVKIADFGIAKWLTPEPGSVSLTLPGTIVGSLQYMSPEQLAGQPVDPRSDLFSIGVMAFEVLTGKVPFGAANYAERIVSVLQDSDQFESLLRKAPALQRTLRRCLARDPGERFASADELQAELVPRMADYRADVLPIAECA